MQAEKKIVFVGRKPVMNYVLACLTLFQNGNEEITLKARGRSISKAVDAALMVTQRFSPGTAVRHIEVDTEQVKDLESETMSGISSIEIRLSK